MIKLINPIDCVERALTASGLHFQDEMSPGELEDYCRYHTEFRERLGV